MTNDKGSSGRRWNHANGQKSPEKDKKKGWSNRARKVQRREEETRNKNQKRESKTHL
jgi:hypothetical protein